MGCNMCPHRCNAVRPLHRMGGAVAGCCASGRTAEIARAGLHFWEEPPVSGTKGAGTVFFSGCNLHCVYCQNYDISSEHRGWEVSAEDLKRIYRELAAAGAHNIDLVTPTHYSDVILESLEESPGIPVVYNSNGYDAVDTLKKFEGKIQIYLPDFKYASAERARKYSGAEDYPQKVVEALQEMFRQVGPWETDGNGIMKKGLIIRHLMLPGGLEDTLRVIRTVAEIFKPGDVLFSLMRQYLPCGRVLAGEFPELNAKVSTRAYDRAVREMFDCGMEDGFTQGRRSACEEFIPVFDGTGVR